MVKKCCKCMDENSYCIDQDHTQIEDNVENILIYYSSKFDEYGLPVYDGENGRATSYILIQYCPWCGEKLPKSKRDQWFKRLEKLGFEAPLDDFEKIPSEYKTSKWWEIK